MTGSDSQDNRNGRNLKQLLAAWRTAVTGTNHPQPPTYTGRDIHLTRFTEKTRDVEPGICFVARVRTTSDGHPYIGKAIAGGASMILAQLAPSELTLSIPDHVVYLQVDDTAETLAWLAAAWEGFPSKRLITIGITGTDGKTTTANILYELLKTAGVRVGLLSTTRAVIGKSEEPLAFHVTTPEAPVIQRHLRRMVDAGLTHCIIEATSHGLAQHRVSAIDFDLAVLTNVTHEHLDYHGDFPNYFAAKKLLFEMLAAPRIAPMSSRKADVTRTAVLNRDDLSYDGLCQVTVPNRLSYGIHSPADLVAHDISYESDKTWFNLHVPSPHDEPAVTTELSQHQVSSDLVGEFNVYNMLAAAATARTLGIQSLQICQGLESVTAVAGRMQRIDRGQPFMVIVDFAHTPNALEKAIKAGQQMCQGQIIVVFGSAGKRDRDKRRLMAEVAALDADLMILTAEDPRTESLDDILETMADGCRNQGAEEGETFWRISDRGNAIHFALTMAKPDDLVLICGKGHEQSMCFGTIEYRWDDRQATREAIDAVLQDRPMPDLGLPTYHSG